MPPSAKEKHSTPLNGLGSTFILRVLLPVFYLVSPLPASEASCVNLRTSRTTITILHGVHCRSARLQPTRPLIRLLSALPGL